MPQFKEGSSKVRQSQADFFETATEEAKERRKKHMKQKYKLLLKEYRCEDSDFPRDAGGVTMLKLLARKEEEFSEEHQDFRSRGC